MKILFPSIKLLFTLITFLVNQFVFTQVSITTANYSQNFGTISKASWTDNLTFSGWYLTAGGTFNYGGTQNITNSAPTNTGGFYTYMCSGDNNIKLGSRQSNTSGGTAGSGQSHIGLRMVNNTGQIIRSIRVVFDAYQLSLAENSNNVNKLTFSYRVSASANTNLTTGFTNVSALDYTAPNNDNSGGTSNQLQGYPGTVSANNSACIDLTINNGEELMLRWTDINNAANDPHLAIDNVQILFAFQTGCISILPVSLTDFKADCDGIVTWKTTSEHNNAFFTLESSMDGINFTKLADVQGAGNSSVETAYAVKVNSIGEGYFRIRQTDFNGKVSVSDIIRGHCLDKNSVQLVPNPSSGVFKLTNLESQTKIYILDALGKQVETIETDLESLVFDFSTRAKGVYFIHLESEFKHETIKINLID